MNPHFVKTLPNLDYLLGGGIVLGKFVEIFGSPGACKSSLTFLIAAKFVRLGKQVVFYDSERKTDWKWVFKLYPVLEQEFGKLFKIKEIDSIEEFYLQCLKSMPLFVNTKGGLSIIDSIAGLPAMDEIIEDDIFADAKALGNLDIEGILKSEIAIRARKISLLLSLLVKKLDKFQISLVVTNHLKAVIGQRYGDTPGGRAVKFYASHRIKVGVKERITIDNSVSGLKIAAELTKSSYSMPFTKCEFQFSFRDGFSLPSAFINYFRLDGSFDMKAGWIHYQSNGESKKIRLNEITSVMSNKNHSAFKLFKDYV